MHPLKPHSVSIDGARRNFPIRILRGIRNALASIFLVSNLMALFSVASLVALVWYTVVAGQPGATTAIIGFSSGIIGTITGYYFNKDQLTTPQTEQSVQGEIASEYSEMAEELRSRNTELTQELSNLFIFIQPLEDEEE